MDVMTLIQAQDRKWAERLLHISWICILLITVAELAIFIMKRLSGTAQNTLEYLLRYLLVPGFLNVLVMSVIHLSSLRFLQKDQYQKQSRLYILGVSLICLNVAWTHRVVQASHVVFIFPILLSISYIGKTPLWTAFGLNISFYALLLLLIHIFEPGTMPDFMEVISTAMLLIICTVICDMIKRRQLELANRVVSASRMSITDSLTGLYNHASFYEQLDKSILRDAHGKGGFSLIVFDIDDFKQINDQYGHDTGDEVLLALVGAIRACVAEDELAFRYGGEEFTILTPKQPQAALSLAEAIRSSFTQRSRDILGGVYATVSAGVCRFDSRHFNGRREFFASADEALYEAKRTGKDKAILWTELLLERQGRPNASCPKK